jgi:hypothetical protein
MSMRGNTSAGQQDITTVCLLGTFLSVPFATSLAVEGIQIGQAAVSAGSSNEFHPLGTTKAPRCARGFGVGPVSAFVTHDMVLVPAFGNAAAGDIGREHYP